MRLDAAINFDVRPVRCLPKYVAVFQSEPLVTNASKKSKAIGTKITAENLVIWDAAKKQHIPITLNMLRHLEVRQRKKTVPKMKQVTAKSCVTTPALQRIFGST